MSYIHGWEDICEFC